MAIVEMSLFERIAAVGMEIMSVEKDMKVSTGGQNSYKAVSDFIVTSTIKKAEEKYRIVSIPVKQELIKSEIIEAEKTYGNKTEKTFTHVDTIKMTIKIFNLDNPAEFIDIESFGKGIDKGDKGFGKAATYARKYALLNAYKIVTGEDPDNKASEELSTEKKEPIQDLVFNYLNQNNDFLIDVLSHFNVGQMGDLNAAQISTIHKNLVKKKLI